MSEESEEKELTVTPAEKPYRRVIKTREVTFTCRICGREYTIQQYPARKPTICVNCWPEHRRQARVEALRRFRAKQKK